jgi:hypothetical protein
MRTTEGWGHANLPARSLGASLATCPTRPNLARARTHSQDAVFWIAVIIMFVLVQVPSLDSVVPGCLSDLRRARPAPCCARSPRSAAGALLSPCLPITLTYHAHLSRLLIHNVSPVQNILLAIVAVAYEEARSSEAPAGGLGKKKRKTYAR